MSFSQRVGQKFSVIFRSFQIHILYAVDACARSQALCLKL
jgi:hypothetical protein